MDEDELVSIAQQLAARVRDESVEDYTRWLTVMVPDPNDWFRLAVVLACAVPDDQTWNDLTLWTYGDGRPDTVAKIAVRQQQLLDALAPKRRAA